jgi:hypothetical protein
LMHPLWHAQGDLLMLFIDARLPSVLDDNGDLGLTGPLVVGVTRDPDELVTWTEGD